MSLASDFRVLYHMVLSPIRGKSHAERLECFYGKQAKDYDAYRAHLLKGRQEMYEAVPAPPSAVWLDIGGGTGSNLEYLSERIGSFRKVYLVDLSPSLLGVAQERIAARGWTNVETVVADALVYEPPEPVDVVTFSYSLTMIPDWFVAIDQARRLLRPGGHIGVVDFYVSRKYPEAGRVRHSWLTRAWWPNWFSYDNVHPSPDHVPYLHRRFEAVQFSEQRMWLRYLPGARVPYYIFIGRKPAEAA